MLRIGTIYSLNAKLHPESGGGFLDYADNTKYRGGGIMNFFGLLDVRVNPYALSLEGLLGEPPFIMYGDSVMQEFTKIKLIMLTLFSLSFVMMSGLGSQASIM